MVGMTGKASTSSWGLGSAQLGFASNTGHRCAGYRVAFRRCGSGAKTISRFQFDHRLLAL